MLLPPPARAESSGCLVVYVVVFISIQLIMLLLFTYLGRFHYTLLLAPWFIARAAPLLLLLWFRNSRAAALPICVGVGVAQLIASATIDPLLLSVKIACANLDADRCQMNCG